MSRTRSVALGLVYSVTTLTVLAACAAIPFFRNGGSANAARLFPGGASLLHRHEQRVPVPRSSAVYEMALSNGHGQPAFHVNLRKNIYYSNRVMVVSFHDMSFHLNSPYNMSPVTFARDLQALRKYDFNVISNRQFIGWMKHQNSIPVNAVMLTFDDGYRSMYTHTFPILRQYHMTGTFFIITHAQDIHSPAFITWSEAQAMAKNGMSIESHTYDLHYEVLAHGHLTPAFDTAYYHGKWQTPTQYFQRDYHDFLTARLQLQQHLGSPVTEIAWPYGYGNLVAYRAAEAAGYQYFYTTAAGVDVPQTSAWYIRRIDVGLLTNPNLVINKILSTAGSPVRLVVKRPTPNNNSASQGPHTL